MTSAFQSFARVSSEPSVDALGVPLGAVRAHAAQLDPPGLLVAQLTPHTRS